jgi:hypothetical protein
MSNLLDSQARYAALCADADAAVRHRPARPSTPRPSTPHAPLPDHQQALAAIAAVLHIPEATLRGASRSRNVCERRQIAMWLLRQQGLSLMEVAALLERDHTTVMHGERVVEARRLAEPAFDHQLAALLPAPTAGQTVVAD